MVLKWAKGLAYTHLVPFTSVVTTLVQAALIFYLDLFAVLV